MNTVKHVAPKLAVTALAVVIVLAVIGRHDTGIAAVTVWHWYFTAARAIWTWITAVLS